MKDLLEINTLLDNLHLYLLHLMQERIECKINIQRLANAAQLLLAKTRYVQGTQTVSAAQLPTENSGTFKALCRVKNDVDDDSVNGTTLKLVHSNIEKSNGYVDPLHWFAILAPSTLRNAVNQYKRVIDLIVDDANIQRKIITVIDSINHLKILKDQL